MLKMFGRVRGGVYALEIVKKADLSFRLTMIEAGSNKTSKRAIREWKDVYERKGEKSERKGSP